MRALAASKAKRRLKPRYDIPTLDASPHMDGYATLAESQNDKDGTVVWNYGGGKNSTAGIIDNINQGLRIDHIIFADTGNEKPETLAFLQIFQRQFLDKHNLKIQIVRNTKWDSLLHNCMTKKIIPRLTIRWCTADFKIKPIRKETRKIYKKTKKMFINISASDTRRQRCGQLYPKIIGIL